uniref:phage baseplate assembly protein V n=1 Tax=Bacteroides nordii TaxID=291645 RepID=UPI0022E6E3EB
VPEIGDQVMVDFELGDPCRPFVSGSMFHRNNGKGGNADNCIKTIITRSGHTLIFDDTKGEESITLKDKNGNMLHINTQHNKIEITATDNMYLNANNVYINAESNIEMTGKVIKENAIEHLNQFAKKINVKADESVDLLSEKVKATGDVVSIYSQKENLTLYSKKNVDTISNAKKIRLS